MTWLFAALWKLPASNSLTTTAEAQECVYGNVGGPKRPRSKLSLTVCSREAAILWPRPAVAKPPHRNAFEIAVRMPIRNREGFGIAAREFHAPTNARSAA